MEIKYFTSNPSSFDPNSNWDELYFIDGTDLINGIIKIYKIILPSYSYEIQSIPVNKNETFGDRCRKGRKSRIKFSNIIRHLNYMYTYTIYNGHIDQLLI